jgi:hypothetical protein
MIITTHLHFMTYLNLFTINLFLIFVNNNPKNDLNLGENLINQMVHYLPMKMTNQIVSYSTNQKDHPSHNNGSKSTCLN